MTSKTVGLFVSQICNKGSHPLSYFKLFLVFWYFSHFKSILVILGHSKSLKVILSHSKSFFVCKSRTRLIGVGLVSFFLSFFLSFSISFTILYLHLFLSFSLHFCSFLLVFYKHVSTKTSKQACIQTSKNDRFAFMLTTHSLVMKIEAQRPSDIPPPHKPFHQQLAFSKEQKITPTHAH